MQSSTTRDEAQEETANARAVNSCLWVTELKVIDVFFLITFCIFFLSLIHFHYKENKSKCLSSGQTPSGQRPHCTHRSLLNYATNR